MPETVLDRVLAAAAEVFGRPTAPDDDFFALGGDSIAAVELAVLLEERLGLEVDTTTIVDAPDLAALAAALTAGAR
nr:acyl carrier protein [Streptomyces sp. TLI_235]